MKIQLTFKTPDVMDYIPEKVADELEITLDKDDYPRNEEDEDRYRIAVNEVTEFISKYIRYGEYITVEFDTKAKTVRAV